MATALEKGRVILMLVRDAYERLDATRADLADAMMTASNRRVSGAAGADILTSALADYKANYQAMRTAFLVIPADPAAWEPTSAQLARGLQ